MAASARSGGRAGRSSANSSSSFSLSWPWTSAKSAITSASGRAAPSGSYWSGCWSRAFARDDRHAYGVSPLGPRPVVITHPGLSQQVSKDKPGVAGSLADTAIDDGLVVRVDETVELFQLLAFAELAGLVDCLRPRDRPRGGDVAGAQRAFLGVVGHVGALAGVLLRRAHVDQWLGAQAGQP